VNVIVVSDQGLNISTPYPSKDLLRQVQQYLDTRKDLTSQLLVMGPYYLPIKVTVNVTVWTSAINQGLTTQNAIKQMMLSNLQTYLHPVLGGLDGQGWQVGQSVFIADLFKAIMPPEQLGFISSLTLAPDTPLYAPTTPSSVPVRPSLPASPGPWVSVADYELVCYSTNSSINTIQQ
jgi:hypothetical protein